MHKASGSTETSVLFILQCQAERGIKGIVIQVGVVSQCPEVIDGAILKGERGPREGAGSDDLGSGQRVDKWSTAIRSSLASDESVCTVGIFPPRKPGLHSGLRLVDVHRDVVAFRAGDDPCDQTAASCVIGVEYEGAYLDLM